MYPKMRFERLAGALGVAAVFLSCNSGGFVSPDPTKAPTPSSIRLDSIPAQIARDDTISLHATVLDENGSTLSGLAVDWSSSDPQVAVVEATSQTQATLAAKDQGTATITATYDQLTASKSVTVHRRPTDLVYVSGSGQTADAGQLLPAPLVVRAVDRRGDPVSGVDVTFVVVTGGGTVSPSGGLTNADGRISAQWTLGSGSAQQLQARASEAQQRLQQLKDSVVVFTATTTGSLAKIALNMDSVVFNALGDSVEPSATGYDQSGTPVQISNISWSSSDTSVASVNSKGLIRGRHNGTAWIQAAAEGVADTMKVRVRQVVTSISVLPAVDTLTAVGDTGYLQATAYDDRGNVVSGAAFNWATTDSSVVEVNNMGRLLAMAVGTVFVIANTASCSDSAGVTVQSLAAVDTTTPSNPTTPGDTVPPAVPTGLSVNSQWVDSSTFTVTASWDPVTDAATYPWRTGTNDGGWSDQAAANSAQATFSAALLANANGYWFCVAAADSSGNVSTDACVPYDAPTDSSAVDTASVATVEVVPSSTSIYVGGATQLTATTMDATGNVLSGRSVSWTTSDAGVASVSSNGLVTGVTVGSTTITATSEGQSGTATVQVVQQQVGSGSVVINGSGFGTKAKAAPVFFNDFDKSTLGAGAEDPTVGMEILENDNPPVMSVVNTRSHSGSQSFRANYDGNINEQYPGLGKTLPSGSIDLYSSQWVYYDRAAGSGRINVYKWERDGSGDPYQGEPVYLITPTGDLGYAGEVGYHDGVSYTEYTGPGGQLPGRGQWHFSEVLHRLSNPPGASNGWIIRKMDGQTWISETGIVTRASGINRTLDWAISTIDGASGIAPGLLVYHYIDDYYVDNTPARVIATNNAVYSNSTDFAAQVITSWTDTQIVIDSPHWPASLSSGQTAYFHYWDANNRYLGYQQVTVP